MTENKRIKIKEVIAVVKKQWEKLFSDMEFPFIEYEAIIKYNISGRTLRNRKTKVLGRLIYVVFEKSINLKEGMFSASHPYPRDPSIYMESNYYINMTEKPRITLVRQEIPKYPFYRDRTGQNHPLIKF